MPVRRTVLATVAALTLGLGGALAVGAPAYAAPADSFEVTNPSGDVLTPNSLPWAVGEAEADPNHTDIVIQSGAGALVTLLTNLVITTDVTITGPGASGFTVAGSAAATADPVFLITGAGPVQITGMSIAPSSFGNVHGIESYADFLTIDDLSLDGFSDDNFRIDAGSLTANNIVTKNSTHDGLSYVNFGTNPASVQNVTATGNGDYGILLLAAGGALDASDLASSDNGGGIDVLAYGSTVSLTRASATANLADGVRLVGSAATATFTDVTSTGNGLGALCGCGGPGIAVIVDAASVVEIARAIVTGNTADAGAGIHLEGVSAGSTVAIRDSTVSGNHATNGGVGGGIAVTSLYDAGSTISISDSSITGNDAEGAGGGVFLNDLGVGAPTGAVSVTRTTIDGNTAGYGAGLLLGTSQGTTSGEPALTVRDSTISDNTASEEGGGLYLYQDPGAAAATVLLTGTTVSGNIARGTSGLGNGGAIYIESAGPAALLDVRLEYSTIAANDPPGVGGVFVDGVGVALSLLSSILAGNDRGDLSFDPAIASFTAQWSLVQDAGLAGIPLDPAQGNITGVDPKLGALAANGGPTRTMLVSPGSAAFNAGDPAITGAGLLDQRGLPRVYQRIDIGAVEWQPALAHTGSTAPEPEAPLVALLFILSGLAMVAYSRLRLTTK